MNVCTKMSYKSEAVSLKKQSKKQTCQHHEDASGKSLNHPNQEESSPGDHECENVIQLLLRYFSLDQKCGVTQLTRAKPLS